MLSPSVDADSRPTKSCDPFGMELTMSAPAAPYASESWRIVWREGFLPSLPTAGLESLRAALIADDQRLVQDATTVPPPLMCVQDWPCEAACALGVIGAMVSGGFADETFTGKHTNPNAATVGAVEEFFGRACYECDQRMGEAAACRHFLNWFDRTPRDEMRRELLAEVELAITGRALPDTVPLTEKEAADLAAEARRYGGEGFDLGEPVG